MGLLNVQEPLANSTSVSSIRSIHSAQKITCNNPAKRKRTGIKSKSSYGLTLQKINKRRRKWKHQEKWRRTRELVVKLQHNIQEYFNEEASCWIHLALSVLGDNMCMLCMSKKRRELLLKTLVT